MIACGKLKIGKLKIENCSTDLITINAALQTAGAIKHQRKRPANPTTNKNTSGNALQFP